MDKKKFRMIHVVSMAITMAILAVALFRFNIDLVMLRVMEPASITLKLFSSNTTLARILLLTVFTFLLWWEPELALFNKLALLNNQKLSIPSLEKICSLLGASESQLGDWEEEDNEIFTARGSLALKWHQCKRFFIEIGPLVSRGVIAIVKTAISKYSR